MLHYQKRGSIIQCQGHMACWLRDASACTVLLPHLTNERLICLRIHQRQRYTNHIEYAGSPVIDRIRERSRGTA